MSTIKDLIKNLPNEEWRIINGYSGKYFVSNMGRIKSLKHRNAKLLTAFPNNKGYPRVALCKDGYQGLPEAQSNCAKSSKQSKKSACGFPSSAVSA
ncbi:NUMOD4 domain-containing protein [Ruminococcus sp.]|uniref:NUMOD4 domain-containing protein n=1 Tax=Ruminococcus sp. TaxID=41978 RepID=UPI003FA7A23F